MFTFLTIRIDLIRILMVFQLIENHKFVMPISIISNDYLISYSEYCNL